MIALGLLLTLSGSLPGPAVAAAKDAKITRVTRAGSSAPLSQGTVVGGTIQVAVSAAADLGLEFVRLEAQSGDDPLWYCLEFWKTDGALSMSETRVWKTANWTDPRAGECKPGICSSCTENSDHQHGAPSANGDYRLRVVAREQGQFNSSNDAISPNFRVTLSNAPTAPAWIGKPESNGKPNPTVILRWSPSPEPDITEYQFVREDPSGNERVFAVSASNPQANGCSRAGSVAYTCPDGGFTKSGTYKYAVRALRPGAGGGRCAVSGAACVASRVGEVKTVAVTVAATSPSSPSATASATGSASPAPDAPATPASQEPVALPTEDAGDGLITKGAASGNAGKKRSAPAIALAGILALGAGGLLLRRRMISRKSL